MAPRVTADVQRDRRPGSVPPGGARSEELGRLLADAARALDVEGNLRVSRELFDRAYRLAEETGDGPGAATAALGLGGLWVHEHRTVADAAVVGARQRHALSLVDPESSLALRLRARLAGEADYRDGGSAAVLAVLDEARRAGDPAAHALALSIAHHCLLSPEHSDRRSALAAELIAEAGRTASRGDLLMGLLWRTVDRFLAADRQAERSLVELRALLADRYHLAVGFVVEAIEVMLTIRAGRFADAERAAAGCAQRGAEAGDFDAAGWHGGQLVAIRWFQGRVGELVPMLREFVHSPTLSSVDNSFFAGLAVAEATAGDRRRAAAALARLCGPDLAGLPRSSTWLVSMNGIVEAADLLADAGTAARAYTLLHPYAGRPAMASLGAVCFGSVELSLGVASLTAGEPERAVGHLRAAVRQNLAIGHWPAVTLSRLRLAQALLRRGRPGDAGDAHTELAGAAREAAGLGMVLPAAPVRELAALPVRSGGPDRRAPMAVFRRRGRQWRIELDRRGVLVEHSVGMLYLAALCANPGREISAVDLAAGPGLRAEPTAAGAGGSGGPAGIGFPDTSTGSGLSNQSVLDEVAKRQYRRRLSRLPAEIDACLVRGDGTRAEALRTEHDWLSAQLATATGPGGVGRRFTDNPERARVAVGKAIRRALARIAQADPVLGEEIGGAVQTGVRCCYRPDGVGWARPDRG